MKKSMKIASILMVIVMMIMVATPVFASSTIEQLEGKIETPSSAGAGKLLNLVGRVLGFLKWAAIVGGVLIITIIGIKYMMGSLEEKAQYQKSLVPLVVGIIVVMGATTIASILFDSFVL